MNDPADPHSVTRLTSSGHSAMDPLDEPRFEPGALVADRYRILGLLGTGGMGEVYRADDLKLNHPVALKFLTVRLVSDGAALVRFHREVRTARQVSHPNVCRVFDIGEFAGQQFLSMEYIDGEDLASLLRRIGRLPGDKALEIARQLCAGLAAAHDTGVLHRDLKPANVMLDGRGRVRITDFGLAVAAERARDEEGLAGTPPYMSPEQLTGKPLTSASDLYALGLVLYEVFTGRRAFEASSLAEYIELHQSGTPASPSSLVKDLDPLVERVILQCLEKEPRKRPASALQVSAALPGGDPLQAALAAGETPSPEMVAASGEKVGVRPVVALVCLGAIAVGLIAAMVLGGRASLLDVTLDNPPVVLMRQARAVSAQLGYPERPFDVSYGMRVDTEYLRHIDQTAGPAEPSRQLASARPLAVLFWYRESPDFLRSVRAGGGGRVTQEDPPQETAGMIALRFDAAGHLRQFDAVPPLLEEDAVGATAIDWKLPFALAGLDISTFTASAPQLIPRHAHDEHGAWTGTYPDQPSAPVRVEAAARRGKLVQFTVSEPWTRPAGQQAMGGERANAIFGFVLFSTILLGAARLAWGNVRRGRGDRRGAYRLFCFIATTSLLSWLFRADHVATIEQRTLVAQALKDALFLGGITWLLYLALEPFVRRRWPQTIVSWSRLLDGEVRDPLVGRDVLFGILAGTVFAGLYIAANLWSRQLHGTHTASVQDLSSLLGVRHFVGWFIDSLFFLQITLGIFFVIFVLRGIVRHEWLAVGLFLLLAAVPSLLFGRSVPELVSSAVYFVGVYYLSVRLGLISLATALWVSHVLTAHPLTSDLSPWYAGFSVALVAALFALALFAFHTSRAGQPLFREDFLQT